MVKEEKLKKVESLRKDIDASPVIAIVDMYKMPSNKLQEIRRALRGRAKIKMIKKIILKFALENSKKENIKELESNIPTQPALVFTDIEAFKFYSLVDNLRFKTFMKEGDVCDEDIWVSAGPTSLMAGPVISEFQRAGIKASIESGRIKIRKDSCVVKKGETVSGAEASILRKLKIKPKEVLLNIVAVYDGGEIYQKNILELTKSFPSMLAKAFNNALNLSVFVTFPTKENIKHLISKAARAADAIKNFASGPEETKEEDNSKSGGDNEKDEEVESKGGKEEKDVNDKIEAKEEDGGAS